MCVECDARNGWVFVKRWWLIKQSDVLILYIFESCFCGLGSYDNYAVMRLSLNQCSVIRMY